MDAQPMHPPAASTDAQPRFANGHLAVHELLRPAAIPGEGGTHLGPARVAAVDGRRVVVNPAAGGGTVSARVALAQSYAPAVGDEVLVIGLAGEWYVIGLLEGKGVTTFVAPGDVEFSAPRGRIEFVARDGVFLKSGLVEIVTEKLQFTARQMFERFTDLTQWVTGAVHQRLGRVRSHVEEDYDLKAGRIKELADEEVVIDGKKIYLG